VFFFTDISMIVCALLFHYMIHGAVRVGSTISRFRVDYDTNVVVVVWTTLQDESGFDHIGIP
jgi:hypothetical protein